METINNERCDSCGMTEYVGTFVYNYKQEPQIITRLCPWCDNDLRDRIISGEKVKIKSQSK